VAGALIRLLAAVPLRNPAAADATR
jgi:hypothetical protein